MVPVGVQHVGPVLIIGTKKKNLLIIQLLEFRFFYLMQDNM